MADVFDNVRNRSGNKQQDVFSSVRSRTRNPGDVSPIDPEIAHKIRMAPLNFVQGIQETADRQKAAYQEQYDKLPRYRQIAADIVNSPVGKAVFKANEASSDFIRGALDTATLGAIRPIDEAVAKSPILSKRDQERMQSDIQRSRESTAGKVGEFAGYLVPGSASYKLIGEATRIASPIARRAIRGVATGALTQTGLEIGEAATGKNDQNLGERALDVGIAGAIGGVADAFLPIIGQKLAGSKVGQSIKKYFSREKKTPVEDIFAETTVSTPQGPTVARVERKPGLSAIIEQIRPTVTERLTPPYENPNELAKWVRDRLDDSSLSLNEVRELPYEDLRQLAEELRSAPNAMYDTAIQVASERGIDLEKLLNPRNIDSDMLARARERQRMRQIAGVPLPVRTIREIKSPIAKTEPEILASTPSAASPRVRPEGLINGQPAPIYRPKEKFNPDDFPFDIEETASNEVDGALDDILVPDPEEVAPRIRDRISSFADDMIANAKKELSSSRNRLSSNPVDYYAQLGKVGAGYMLKGAVKLADFTEAMIRDFGEEIRPHIRQIFSSAKEQYKVFKKEIESEELGLTGFEGQELKDLTNINLNTADVYRNFRKVFGKAYPSVKKAVLEPFDEAKGSFAKQQKQLMDDLFRDVVRGLGIKKGSKLSALVQQFGEGQISLDELKAAAPEKWNDVVKAASWFRKRYDKLLSEVNESIAKIYPNNPSKLVPARNDYFRHFRELSAISAVKNFFDSASGKISPSLSGVSPYTKPKSKWASFKQRRGEGEFKNDAVGGFLDYIPAATYAIHIDPHISVFRNLAKHLAEQTETTKNLNNFIKYLNNFANDLAGKTSPFFDRGFEELFGRKTLQVLNQINSRVKSNVILGNARSALSQLANIPNGIAFGGVDAAPGAFRTVMSAVEPNPAMQESNFLQERYLDKNLRKFSRWWEQPRRAAEAMMELTDRIGTSFIWNTAYTKAVRTGIANPVKYADEQTRRLVSGRGVGEQPLFLKSNFGKLVAPFQLEVNNLWRIMKDFVDERQFGALATLFAANWLLNKSFEKVTGSGVVFDPIDAIYTAVSENDVTPIERFGRVGGEVLSNLPLGQTIASMYPEYGTNIAGVDLPSREKLFGDKDPTRFGSGLLATRSIKDPLFSIVLPFGGNQLKKSIQGGDALSRGGSFTDNIATTGIDIEEPKLRFPVSPTAGNVIRSTLFGPYATTEGQQYTGEDRRPLSERQTRIYQISPDPTAYYNALQEIRKRKAATK